MFLLDLRLIYVMSGLLISMCSGEKWITRVQNLMPSCLLLYDFSL